MKKIKKTDEEWQQQLTPEQYTVCRQAATEAPFSGALYENKEQGTYHCACCDLLLFNSDTKYDSGSGWPSFSDVMSSENVILRKDLSHVMQRTEVLCASCDAHLGHVFEDGPEPTGKRYCINSVALDFHGD